MWLASLLVAFGGMPCLPDELGDPPAPSQAEDPPAASPPAAPAPSPSPAVPAANTSAPTAPTMAPASIVPTAPPAPRNIAEATRYRVAYGVLGALGEVNISFSSPGSGVRATGSGRGSLFGMGSFEKHLQSDLDPAGSGTRRWTTTRVQSGKTITDTIEQPAPGAIEMVRRRHGRPDEPSRFVRARAVLDPLGFLWRLRTRPPQAAEAFEVLDGRALWVITVQPARPVFFDGRRPALALKGRAEPIFWDGSVDPERTARGFTLWIEDDPFRTPLRLVMPLAVGEVRVDLQQVSRPVAAGANARPAPPARGPVLPRASAGRATASLGR